MTDQTPDLKRGDEYIVFYKGGPNDGRIDRRISTDGSWDEELTVVASIDGKETLINYNFESWRELGDQYQVEYVYDPKDSDELEDPEDRNDL